MSSARELAAAEARLAETESVIAEGLGGPYAEQNLVTHRKRVARLRAEMPAPTPTAAVAPMPAPKPAPAAPQPTGTREQRLIRLAKAMGGDEATLETAIRAGTTPDAFAVQLTDTMIAEQEIEAIVERITNA